VPELPPFTLIPRANPSKFKQLTQRKGGTNSVNLAKIAHGIYAPVGRLYSKFWSNLSKISVLGVLYPYSCTDGDENRREGVDLRDKKPKSASE